MKKVVVKWRKILGLLGMFQGIILATDNYHSLRWETWLLSFFTFFLGALEFEREVKEV